MKATELKPQDLRIGNYVKTPIRAKEDDLVTQDYCVIRSITERTAFWQVPMTIEGMNKKSGSAFEDLEPISLTEEWLLKFGFEITKISNITHLELKEGNMKFLFFDSIIQFGILGVSQYEWSSPVRIEYIHQLQNLYFALTGEELTIKQ